MISCHVPFLTGEVEREFSSRAGRRQVCSTNIARLLDEWPTNNKTTKNIWTKKSTKQTWQLKKKKKKKKKKKSKSIHNFQLVRTTGFWAWFLHRVLTRPGLLHLTKAGRVMVTFRDSNSHTNRQLCMKSLQTGRIAAWHSELLKFHHCTKFCPQEEFRFPRGSHTYLQFSHWPVHLL